MKILIKKATIIQPGQDELAKRDILIEDGIITNIAKGISDSEATVI